MLGGWLVWAAGYEGAFALGLVFALLGLAATLPLTEAVSAPAPAAPAPKQAM